MRGGFFLVFALGKCYNDFKCPLAGEGGSMSQKERVNLVFLLTVTVYIGLSFVVSSLPIRMPFAVNILVSQLGLVLVPALFAFQSGYTPAELGIKKLPFRAVILIIVFSYTLQPVLTFLNALSQCFVDTPTTSQIISAADRIGFVEMFLLVAVTPAVLEEFVYRGIFFQSYSEIAVLPGAVLSGLLFGVMHGNLNQFFYAFFMGFAFSMVVYATGSLLSSMLMHLVINGTSTVLLYLLPNLTESSGAEGESLSAMAAEAQELTVSGVLRTYLLPAVFGLVLSVMVYRAIVSVCHRNEQLKAALSEKGKGKAFLGFFTLPLVAGCLCMIVLMVASELLG